MKGRRNTMEMVTLGKTGITVNKNGFGALPIQRISEKEAVCLIRKAYDAGIRFFDTARFYTDSECKLGAAFEGFREKVYIASKTGAVIWKPPLAICIPATWICINSIIRHSVPNRETEADFMRPCWRQKPRERSGTLELPITVCPLQTKPLTAACMRHFSSPSVIWLPTKIWNW